MSAHFSLKVGFELTPIPEIAETAKELTHTKTQGLGLKASGRTFHQAYLKPFQAVSRMPWIAADTRP